MHHVSYLIFNLVLSELLSAKIEESKSNYILNWISIEVQFFAMRLSKFLIFVAIELLSVETEKPQTNYIPNHHIYLCNKIPLHILEMYGFKKV